MNTSLLLCTEKSGRPGLAGVLPRTACHYAFRGGSAPFFDSFQTFVGSESHVKKGQRGEEDRKIAQLIKSCALSHGGWFVRERDHQLY